MQRSQLRILQGHSTADTLVLSWPADATRLRVIFFFQFSQSVIWFVDFNQQHTRKRFQNLILAEPSKEESEFWNKSAGGHYHKTVKCLCKDGEADKRGGAATGTRQLRSFLAKEPNNSKTLWEDPVVSKPSKVKLNSFWWRRQLDNCNVYTNDVPFSY